MPQDPDRDERRRRIALLSALAGFAMFALGDGVTKSTAGLWPGVAVGALRFSLGAIVLSLILLLREGAAGFRMPRPMVQIGRGVSIGVATACFFTAIQWIPLATVITIGFTAPLWTAIISATVLREHVPLRIWTTIGLALIGVLLVLRPSFGAMGVAALLPLAGAMAMALLMILNRQVADCTPGLLSQVLVSAFAVPVLVTIAGALHMTGEPAFHIGAPGWPVVWRAAVVGFGATIAHWLIYRATVHATAATIAPAGYVQLPIAIAVGWVVFGDIPDWLDIVGIGLIVIAGVRLMTAPASGRHAAEQHQH
ncbi:MAG: DMT family transporter [Sphingomonadaceae bacterium]